MSLATWDDTVLPASCHPTQVNTEHTLS